MTDGVRPIPPIPPVDRRSSERRSDQRRGRAAEDVAATSRALVPTEPSQSDSAEPAERAGPVRDVAAGPAAAFAAQLIGQGGQRKGIRGGPPVLEAARSTYLGAEYSGDKERRPPAGKTGKTEV